MLSPSELKWFLGKAEDQEETNRLKAELNRRPSLTPNLFQCIAHWKLRNQYGRVAWLFTDSAEQLRRRTEAAFRESPDTPEKLSNATKELQKMHGVGIGIASAILALRFPANAAVVDFRGWRQVFCEERRSFTVKQYVEYVEEVRRIANKLGKSPQGADLAIWQKDKSEHPSKQKHGLTQRYARRY